MTIGAVVPGDLISDLQRANLIFDPLFNQTFQDGSLWDRSVWVYTSPMFSVPSLTDLEEVYLVFDGVKMAADVSVNGVPIATLSDQFLRWIFPVKAHLFPSSSLHEDSNAVTVAFRTSGDPCNNETRWMGCSGGWDWAPYSTTNYSDGTRTFTKGITKAVYVVPVVSAAISAVVPQIFYAGATFPDVPLTAETTSPFNVSVKVVLEVPLHEQNTGDLGVLHVTGDWNGGVSVDVPVPASTNRTTSTIEISVVLPPCGQYQSLVAQSTWQSNLLLHPRAVSRVVPTVPCGDDGPPRCVSGGCARYHKSFHH